MFPAFNLATRDCLYFTITWTVKDDKRVAQERREATDKRQHMNRRKTCLPDMHVSIGRKQGRFSSHHAINDVSSDSHSVSSVRLARSPKPGHDSTRYSTRIHIRTSRTRATDPTHLSRSDEEDIIGGRALAENLVSMLRRPVRSSHIHAPITTQTARCDRVR